MTENRVFPTMFLWMPSRIPEEFSSVLEHWLKEDDAWREPRRRFFNGFLKQEYSIDRLLTAANAFEVLPVGSIPPEKEPSEDLQTALDCCKKKLGELLEEPDRNSVFSAFGRVGKSSLKKKVRHRAQVITDEIEDRLPEFSYVTGEAVNCRNHYVHGTCYGIDYEKESIWGFLLETLEFVFVVSCLIDAGWKIQARYERDGSLGNHPFDRYITNYERKSAKVETSQGQMNLALFAKRGRNGEYLRMRNTGAEILPHPCQRRKGD